MANSALIDELRKQFAENPRRVFARLANEYRKRGELDSAIEICRSHVPLQPGYISGHIVLGQALYDSGSLDEARAAFETALALDPENLIALRHMGDIARDSGDVSGARAWYRQLLEVDSQNEDAAEQLQSLDADGNAAAGQGASQMDEAAGWGEINPIAVELAGDETPSDSPGATAAASDSADLGDGQEVNASVTFDAGGSEELAVVPALAEPVAGLEVGEALDDAAAAASPMDLMEMADLVEMADLAPDAPRSAFGEEVDLDAGSRPAPPLFPPDPSGADAYPDPVASEGPSAFATETMAELYLQQGLPERALAIYRDLAARRPDDASLRERVAELEEASALAPAPVQGSGKPSRTAREFFGVLAYRRAPRSALPDEAASELFPGATASVAPADESAAAALAQAFSTAGESDDAAFAASLLGATAPYGNAVADDRAVGVDAAEAAAGISGAESDASVGDGFADYPNEDAGVVDAAEARLDSEGAHPESQDSNGAVVAQQEEALLGRPGREASSALSLDDVFRDGSSRENSRREAAVSFDEFFARRENGAVPESSNGTAAADAERASIDDDQATDDAPQDLELFHAWLDGLKG